MDADSLIHIAHPTDGHSRVSAISMLHYGPEVAIPRIVDSYRRARHPPDLLHPGLVHRAVSGRRRGDPRRAGTRSPITASCTSIRASSRPSEEAHWLDRGIEVIERVTGQRPRGWRAPLYNFSHRSADLLVVARVSLRRLADGRRPALSARSATAAGWSSCRRTGGSTTGRNTSSRSTSTT